MLFSIIPTTCPQTKQRVLCRKGNTSCKGVTEQPGELSRRLPVDVEHADEGVLLHSGVQGLVDVLHDPVEELGVDVLGQGVPGVHHLVQGHALHVGLGRGDELAVAEPVLHLAVLHAQQAAEAAQVLVLALGGTTSQVSRLVTAQRGILTPKFTALCKEWWGFVTV